VWWRLPHLTTYDITEIDTEVWAVLTEIGGGGRNDPKSNHRYCGGERRRILG
jgi:hypothetical protein